MQVLGDLPVRDPGAVAVNLDAQVALLEAQLERSRLDAALRLSEARLIHAAGAR